MSISILEDSIKRILISKDNFFHDETQVCCTIDFFGEYEHMSYMAEIIQFREWYCKTLKSGSKWMYEVSWQVEWIAYIIWMNGE